MTVSVLVAAAAALAVVTTIQALTDRDAPNWDGSLVTFLVGVCSVVVLAAAATTFSSWWRALRHDGQGLAVVSVVGVLCTGAALVYWFLLIVAMHSS